MNRHVQHRESTRSEYGSKRSSIEVAALGSMPDQFAMRRNTIAKRSCDWNSLTIRNCHRLRILHKHNQHPPCSVLDMARYQTLHPIRYTINILRAQSVFSL